MGISSNAQLAEKIAFEKLSKKLGKTTAFAKPAGFDTGFPDFGIRMMIDGKKIDLHIEYNIADYVLLLYHLLHPFHI